MKTVRTRQQGWRRPALEAEEPRSYDRRFYARALLAALVIIVVTAGILIYRLAIYEEEAPAIRSPLDLRSLHLGGAGALPDPDNPAILIQEHLEATRKGAYDRAYRYFCDGLCKQVSLEQFKANAESNSLLFKEVAGYSFPGFEVTGSSARATGYIVYKNGARSKVQAEFAKEGDRWKIALVTVVYQ